MQSLLNVLNNNGFTAGIGESRDILYLPGYPLQYRFDASSGNFNIGGEKPITKKGEPLTIQVCAYRIFRDSIIGFPMKRWTEFFFLSEKHAVCNLLVHGYSVDNLMRIIQAMYYDQVRTIKLIPPSTTHLRNMVRGWK